MLVSPGLSTFSGYPQSCQQARTVNKVNELIPDTVTRIPHTKPLNQTEPERRTHTSESISEPDPDKEREALIQLWMQTDNLTREAATALIKDHGMF